MGAIDVQPADAAELTPGFGATCAPDCEGSDDHATAPLWNLRATDLYDPETYVQLLGSAVASSLMPHPHLRLGLSAVYRPDYNDVDDSAVQSVKALRTRSWSVRPSATASGSGRATMPLSSSMRSMTPSTAVAG